MSLKKYDFQAFRLWGFGSDGQVIRETLVKSAGSAPDSGEKVQLESPNPEPFYLSSFNLLHIKTRGSGYGVPGAYMYPQTQSTKPLTAKPESPRPSKRNAPKSLELTKSPKPDGPQSLQP